MTQSVPRILLTMGEPAGIGPELLVRIAQLNFEAELIAIADPDLLMLTAKKLKLPLQLKEVNWEKQSAEHQLGTLLICPVKLPAKVVVGQLCVENAQVTLDTLIMASDLALAKKVDAIVTAPVHKANLNHADSHFMGHTEFFAKQANVDKVVMMLASGGLRITLATTHIPLSKVSLTIDKALVAQTLRIIFDSFQLYGLSQPKVAVCGLNPHAGEDGLLGHEDREEILPAIQEFVQKGQSVFGPFPADTLFTPQKRRHFDVFLAMYHDQGLPVVKAFGFGKCANVTLGLPFIRTSVDHGTALDIAPSYSASADSLEYAVNYAIQLVSGELPQ